MFNNASTSQHSADDHDRISDVAGRLDRAFGDEIDDVIFATIVDLILYGE